MTDAPTALQKIQADYDAYAERYDVSDGRNFGIAIGYKQFREAIADAWDAGYSKGNLDGYFGSRDEKNPYREGS